MSRYGPVHPLDVELADLVDSVVDEARAAQLEAHLAGCLLCRVKCQRLRAAPPAPLDTDPFFSLPSFRVAQLDEPAEPAVNELWVTAGDDRMLVLVRGVEAGRAAVAPVTFDVEAADDETVVLGAGQSPLSVALAIYPALTTELPRAALAGRVAAFARKPDLSAATRGSPITGASDPRLDVRQYLADRLGSMEASLPDPQTAADAPAPRPEQVRSALLADLRAMRGDTCTVRPLLDWQDIFPTTAFGPRRPAQRLGWTPIASLDEVGVVLVVLDTSHGLADDQDFDAARSVLTRLNATALVVLAREVSELADVFDSSSLNYGIETPSGAHSPPRPLIAGLTPFDAIAKYLDQHTGARGFGSPSRGSVAHVDVGEVLRESASAVVADLVRQGARFKIAPKRRGYESLAEAHGSVEAALERSFAGESVVDDLLSLARRDGDKE